MPIAMDKDSLYNLTMELFNVRHIGSSPDIPMIYGSIGRAIVYCRYNVIPACFLFPRKNFD